MRWQQSGGCNFRAFSSPQFVAAANYRSVSTRTWMLAENTNMNFNLLTFWPVLFVSFCSFSAKKLYLCHSRLIWMQWLQPHGAIGKRRSSLSRHFRGPQNVKRLSQIWTSSDIASKNRFPLGNFFGDGEKLTGWAQILIQRKEKSFLVCWTMWGVNEKNSRWTREENIFDTNLSFGEGGTVHKPRQVCLQVDFGSPNYGFIGGAVQSVAIKENLSCADKLGVRSGN